MSKPDIRKMLGRVLEGNRFFKRWRMLEEQNKFILFQLKRANIDERFMLLKPKCSLSDDVEQTRSSFDFQWHEFSTGDALPDDKAFMGDVESIISEMTDLPKHRFKGMKAIDIGCGAGRFTYGMLSLGASVTACDQSPWALERTKELCASFADKLSTQRIDLIKWEEPGDYDLAFCFGVVHHTGNTYLAIRNVANKVKLGGRIFLMVYGFPKTLADFLELNAYEELREELRDCSLEEKKKTLIDRFGYRQAHGWFDAISPRINDLLTMEEIRGLLIRLGFDKIKRTMKGRNHHVVAERIRKRA